MTHYFEDIRISKFNYDLMLEQSKNLGLEAYYNNTLYGTKYEKFKGVGINSKNQTFNLSEFDPIEIFNDNTVRNLGLVNRFLIKPAYSTLKIKLESTIDNNIKTFQVIYIVTLSLFLAAIFILYVFVWRPFENSLNTTVNLFFILICLSFFKLLFDFYKKNRFTKRKICFRLYLKKCLRI